MVDTTAAPLWLHTNIASQRQTRHSRTTINSSFFTFKLLICETNPCHEFQSDIATPQACLKADKRTKTTEVYNKIQHTQIAHVEKRHSCTESLSLIHLPSRHGPNRTVPLITRYPFTFHRHLPSTPITHRFTPALAHTTTLFDSVGVYDSATIPPLAWTFPFCFEYCEFGT